MTYNFENKTRRWKFLNIYITFRRGGQMILSRGRGIWLLINMGYLIIENIIYGYQLLNIEKRSSGSILSPLHTNLTTTDHIRQYMSTYLKCNSC